MRKLPLLCFALLCFILNPAVAVSVNSIYKGEIPLANQSAKDKSEALPAALEQVLIKVSGKSNVVHNSPNLQVRLKFADKLVQESHVSSNANKSLPYLLTVQFEPEGVNKILRDSNISIWGADRPLILGLVVYENPKHPADVVDNSTPNEALTALTKNARHRGLPFILPLMDVADLNDITAKDILKKSLKPLQHAGKRYDSNVLLIAHIAEENSGVQSDWLLVTDTDQSKWDINGKSVQEVTEKAMTNVAETLAKRYAAVITATASSSLSIIVKDVKQQAELLKLMKFIQRLAPVSDVILSSVSGDEITLEINLHGSRQAFMQAITAGKKLVLIPSKDPDDTLQYKWMH